MNLFTNKKMTQKITIVLLIIILFNFLVPIKSNAGLAEFGGDLLKELKQLVDGFYQEILYKFQIFYIVQNIYLQTR